MNATHQTVSPLRHLVKEPELQSWFCSFGCQTPSMRNSDLLANGSAQSRAVVAPMCTAQESLKQQG